MAVTLSEIEGEPARYPPVNVPIFVWQRIESWVRHRWTERSVKWIAEGPGELELPLSPAVVDSIERWNGAWVEDDVTSGPLGLVLPPGTYRISATVGADNPLPQNAMEAAMRLARYMEGEDHVPGASSYSFSLEGALSEEYRRKPSWLAHAIYNSGAADLLRPWRTP